MDECIIYGSITKWSLVEKTRNEVPERFLVFSSLSSSKAILVSVAHFCPFVVSVPDGDGTTRTTQGTPGSDHSFHPRYPTMSEREDRG